MNWLDKIYYWQQMYWNRWQPEWMSWKTWHGLLTGKGHCKSIPTAQTHQIVIREPVVTKTDCCVALEHTAKTTADGQLALMICAGPESKCLSMPRGSRTLYSFRGSGRQINRLLLWWSDIFSDITSRSTCSIGQKGSWQRGTTLTVHDTHHNNQGCKALNEKK